MLGSSGAVARALSVLALTAAGSLLAGATAGAAPLGALTQLPSPNDCITANNSGCGTTGLSGFAPQDVAVSRDGKSVYATGSGGGLWGFDRDASTGVLSDPTKATGAVLQNPDAVTLSPDDQNVYVTDFGNNTVFWFFRGQDGSLTYQDCITGKVSNGPPCSIKGTDGLVNGAPFDVAVSPDGKSVYVVSVLANALLMFDRDVGGGSATHGKLTPADCIEGNSGPGVIGCGKTAAPGLVRPISVKVSSDGANVYVAAGGTYSPNDTAGAIVEFARTGGASALTQLASPNNCVTAAQSGCGTNNQPAFVGPENLAIAPDGRDVYVTAVKSNTVTGFRRGGGGALTARVTLGGAGVSSPQGVAIDPDGRNVYVSSPTKAAIALFARDAGNGAIAQLPAPDDCIAQGGVCGTPGATGLNGARRLVLSPTGNSLYVAAFDARSLAEFARQTTGPAAEVPPNPDPPPDTGPAPVAANPLVASSGTVGTPINALQQQVLQNLSNHSAGGVLDTDLNRLLAAGAFTTQLDVLYPADVGVTATSTQRGARARAAAKRKTVVIARARRHLAAATNGVRIRVPLTAAGRKLVRAAIRRRTTLRTTVAISVTSAAQPAAATKRSFTLKARRKRTPR